MIHSRLEREAQDEIARTGPPQAPWEKFPKIPGSVSIGWQMGSGEAYLRHAFYPWWRSLTADEKRRYLDTRDCPPDWRELLEQETRSNEQSDE
jgi:hypothetical protein